LRTYDSKCGSCATSAVSGVRASGRDRTVRLEWRPLRKAIGCHLYRIPTGASPAGPVKLTADPVIHDGVEADPDDVALLFRERSLKSYAVSCLPGRTYPRTTSPSRDDSTDFALGPRGLFGAPKKNLLANAENQGPTSLSILRKVEGRCQLGPSAEAKVIIRTGATWEDANSVAISPSLNTAGSRVRLIADTLAPTQFWVRTVPQRSQPSSQARIEKDGDDTCSQLTLIGPVPVVTGSSFHCY
jgi:hypothetical protein